MTHVLRPLNSLDWTIPPRAELAMTNDNEMDSKFGFSVATPRQAFRYIVRAVRLRCPNCGGGPVLKNWFKLRVRCPKCGIRLERGEHDYFSGSILLNYAMGTLIFAGALGGILVASWPVVPWLMLEIVLPIILVVTPVILWPFSKLLWLAADLVMRPATSEELEWHRHAAGEWSTERSAVSKAKDTGAIDRE